MKLTPVISREHHILNRSTIARYSLPESGRYLLLDRLNPVAYKNKTWKYYFRPTKETVVFFNSKNGPPFFINKKTGTRITNKYNQFMQRAGLDANFRYSLKTRNPSTHTWDAYLRRIREAPRPNTRGAKNAKYNAIHEKVKKLVNGNRSSLNNVSLSNIMFWLKKTNWMNPRDYHIKSGKVYSWNGKLLTKSNIIRNIEQLGT